MDDAPESPDKPTAEIIRFNGVTRLDIDPDLVLKDAIGRLAGVVILGYDKLLRLVDREGK